MYIQGFVSTCSFGEASEYASVIPFQEYEKNNMSRWALSCEYLNIFFYKYLNIGIFLTTS